MQENIQRPYQVSELTQEIRTLLEENFTKILLEGEVSNFHPASSGHWYFSLKDEHAIIQAIMFRNSQKNIIPKDGDTVRVYADISVYPKRGNYQLICTHLERIGKGNILQILEERKQKLASKGLFAEEHKKALPFFPKRVIVLSSETGAAVRDIIRVLKRRAPWVNICVANIPVQGEGAGKCIVKQLQNVDKLGDVIIIGRGGGSVEDLLPFSDEELIHAIYNCSTPIISAVGHEIDWALSDYVADIRASTPSVAAEIVCDNAEHIRKRLLTSGKIIIQSFNNILRRLSLALKPFKKEILIQSFQQCIQPHKLSVDDARETLITAMQQKCTNLQQQLLVVHKEIAACNPYAVLKRGYSIVWNTEENIVSNVHDAKKEDTIYIQFHDGKIQACLQKKDLDTGE